MGCGVREAAGGTLPRVQMARDTHALPQTALFISISLIFRSKLILAFNNLCRTEKSPEISSRGRQPGAPMCVCVCV